MVDLTLARDLAIILAIAFTGGYLAWKLKLPLLVGYILGGFLAGALLGQFINFGKELGAIGEIGVAFLLFTLGIEFSFKRLARVSKVAFWGGVLQILATIILGLLIFPLLGFDFYSSLFLASAFSLSSTVVVVKILSERGEVDTLQGEIMIGWLLVQDLAVLPMMVILPTLSSVSGQSWFTVIVAVIKSLVFLWIVLLLGKRILPGVLGRIAAAGSREILLLSVVSLCLAAAFTTHTLGLSFALGALFAGLLVSESSQKNAIFSEIRPLRDVFSVVFFVILGLLLTPAFLLANLGTILVMTAAVILIKFILIVGLTLWLGYHTKTAFLVGLGLVQVGEFAFILAQTGMGQNFISPYVYSMILTVTVLSMLAAPAFFGLAPKIYQRFKNFTQLRFGPLYTVFFKQFDHRIALEKTPISDHVIICGHGRVGKNITEALEMAHINYIVIDFNQSVISGLANSGRNVIYGDPTEREVLEAAGVACARALVIALPDRYSQEMIIQNSLRANPEILIICRSHFEEDKKHLLAIGAHLVIQPEFEAGISMGRELLSLLKTKPQEIDLYLTKIKNSW
ncbi:MAG: cation:proton antiporter [bacterium]|nr:cation:proton antiporter [bacterium]